ncbi:MAG: hypothetical protein CR982_01825 [Candidatus Cloacimonadota bacterium]|nr:MAG: hypothetical protein CR982_01825 [Candidatus Cloacimonadota bacterium]PIE79155.1 MAG: hypothetical protein CSA15_04235 [Candidatus Delongbacteria bacterium]
MTKNIKRISKENRDRKILFVCGNTHIKIYTGSVEEYLKQLFFGVDRKKSYISEKMCSYNI